jgi:hypothetical protein
MNFASISIQGNVLSLEMLDKIRHDQQVSWQSPKDFGLTKNTTVRDEIGTAWRESRLLWTIYKSKLENLAEGEYATSETRKLWMIPLLMNLGYDPDTASAIRVGEKTYPISHRDTTLGGFPILIMGYHDAMDRKPDGNRLRMSPHALLQEYLNSTEHLYGLVTNGRVLRVLRDSTRLSRLAYLEFDLEKMMEEELYNEFALLYRVLHATRMPQSQHRAEQSFIEQYHQDSIDSGARIRTELRKAVKNSMETLANGFLSHPDNHDFVDQARQDEVDAALFYKLLLRTMYRLIFIATIEERDLVFTRKRSTDSEYETYLTRKRLYAHYYSLERLRKLSASSAYIDPQKHDLWKSLLTTFRMFEPLGIGEKLGVQPLGGELFSAGGLRNQAADFYALNLSNRDLLTILNNLTTFRNESDSLVRVNYRDLDVEELGSVYEALLELHPYINFQLAQPLFAFTEGSERKLTGSYYTRHDLVAQLIKTALMPVIKERLQPTRTPQEKQQALLNITVCDPAAGSGHFLIAAARTLGFELAKVRSGEENPGDNWVQQAIRDVVQHCIYGVDKNPAAIELCRISLWLVGHNSGKPLTFLEHKIRVGDSLVGVHDIELLKTGIPEEAFKPSNTDEKQRAATYKKKNKAFLTRRQMSLFGQAQSVFDGQSGLAEDARKLSAMPVNSVSDYDMKRELWDKLAHDPRKMHLFTACNLFTYAFYQRYGAEVHDAEIITSEHVAGILQSRGSYNARAEAIANAGWANLQFFHWFLEFPEISDKGGFDVMLANPPWERIKLQEKEFFGPLSDEIANASNAAARKRLIQEIKQSNPELYDLYDDALHESESASAFIHGSGRYPLTGRGDINTYSIFSELIAKSVNDQGRAGFIVKTGIATDDTNKYYFSYLIESCILESLFDFENRRKIFEDVDSREKFSLITINKRKINQEATFGFFLHDVLDLLDDRRIFNLSRQDFLNINPNTKTTPIFRTRQDAELTAKIYSRVPVLINEEKNQNPWGVSFMRMFDMSNDSHLFRTEAQLTSQGYTLMGNRFIKDDEIYLPLYEGKMIWHYDHRFGTYEGVESRGNTNLTTLEQYKDPKYILKPWYWVHTSELNETTSEIFFAGFRDITNTTNKRSVVPSIFGLSAVGHTLPLIITEKNDSKLLLNSMFSSLVFDYLARQKIGGIHLTYSYLKQLPVLTEDLINWLLHLTLELSYTAWDSKRIADQIWMQASESLKELLIKQWELNKMETGGNSWNPPKWDKAYPEIKWNQNEGCPFPPFKWDEGRRAQLMAEFDAFFALLYGLERDELRYILDPQDVFGEEFPGETFRGLKVKEIRQYGEYRTRRLVLEAYDKLRPTWDMEAHIKKLEETWAKYQVDNTPNEARQNSTSSVSEPSTNYNQTSMF